MIKKQIVVDASVMVKWLRSEHEDLLMQAERLLRDFQEGKVELYAPELAKYEVGNVLVKRKLTVDEARASLVAFYNIPTSFISETKELAQMTYKLASDLEISFYDGAYLALAQELGGMLVTENVKHLGRATKVKVISLAEYGK